MRGKGQLTHLYISGDLSASFLRLRFVDTGRIRRRPVVLRHRVGQIWV